MNNKIVSTAVEMLIFWNELEEEQKPMSPIEKMWMPIVYKTARTFSRSNRMQIDPHRDGISERHKP